MLNESLPRQKGPGKQFIHLIRSLSIFWAEDDEGHKKPLHDLVVPGKSRDVDGLTRWVTNEWIPFWHSLKRYFLYTAPEPASGNDLEVQPAEKEDDARRESNVLTAPTLVQVISRALIRRRSLPEALPEDTPEKTDKNLVTYRIGRIRTFTSFVTMIVACLLPTAAIAILATMHSTAEVLGFIGLFTALFATGLMCLTESATSRTEIFTATAAYVSRNSVEFSSEEANMLAGSRQFWWCLCRIRMVHRVGLMGENSVDALAVFCLAGSSTSPL